MTRPSPGPFAADPVSELAERLRVRTGTGPSARELAEALWLARHITRPRLAVDEPEHEDQAARSEPATEPDSDRPDADPVTAPPDIDPQDASLSTADDRTRLYANRLHGPAAELTDPEFVRVRVPVAAALPHSLRIQRALRPLQRYHPPVRMPAHRIDEQATAERAAETGLLLPVLAATARREARLRFLMDVSSSTAVWDGLLEELRQIAAGLGAFREVSVHYVHEGPDEGLLASVSPDPDAGAPRAAEQLRDPTGRQLTLVLSDCAGPLWRSGRMQRLLHHWALAAPIAVIQPMPQRLWRRTHLPARPGTLRRREGLGARLEFRSAEGAPSDGAMPVPVLAPTRTALGTWARLLSGSTGLSLSAAAAWVYADHPASPPRPARASTDSDADLVRFFRGTASRQAVSLAVSLSAVPLTLPVMQLVQRAMQPQSGPSVLAEVLLSGLLVRSEEAGWYEFVPGVRDELLRLLPRGDALLVLKHCGEYVDRHFGRHARNFPALALAKLTGGVVPSEEDGGTEPVPEAFAEVSGLVLGRFSVPAASMGQLARERETVRIVYRGGDGEGGDRPWATWIAHVMASCGYDPVLRACPDDAQFGAATQRVGPSQRALVLLGGELGFRGAVPGGCVRLWVDRPPAGTRIGRDPLLFTADEAVARWRLLTALGLDTESYVPSGAAPEFPGPRHPVEDASPLPTAEGPSGSGEPEAQSREVSEPGPIPGEAVRTRPGPSGTAESLLIVHAGYHRAWAAWIASCLERHGHRATLQRWDPQRNEPLESSLGDLLLFSGRVLLVLDDWFFSLGPRPAGEWNDVLRGFVASHADRFAAVNLTNRPLLRATAVLEPASLWGLSEEAAEERLLGRLGLERRRRPRALPTRARYPNERCAIWGEVPRRNPRFTGRDELLTDLHQRLADAGPGAAACTLLGMSGIGKTQLATEYAHRFSTDYDLVWWVNSDDRDIQRDRFGELAVELGLRIGSAPGGRIRAVRDALRRGEPHHNWLLIFDGWDGTEDINVLLPQGPGHTLITSRNRAWSEFTDILEVPAFLRGESIGYLMRRAPHINVEEADEVAAEFGDIPLPLVQAASWLGESGVEVPEYLRMVREHRLSTVDEPATGDVIPQSSMTSWTILLNRLRRSQPQALDVLNLCTSFAPGRIPLGLIHAYPQADLPEELRWMATDLPAWTRALDTLVNYSVVTRETRGPVAAETGPHQETVHMHRLVHNIVSQLTSDDSHATYSRAVRTLLAEADPGNPLDSRNWPRYAELLPHLEPSGALSSTQRRVQETVLNCLRYCFRSGEYASGRDLAQRIRDYWSRTLEPLDQPMLDLTAEECNIMRASGRFREAYDLDRGVLERLRAAEQPNALGELNAKGAMANSLYRLGRYQEAHDMHREVLDGTGRLLGLDTLPGLAARHDLGVSLRLLGRYAEAYELDLDTLSRQESILRARHINTLSSGNAVTHDLRLLGRYRDALARQEAVVRLHAQVLGPHHPQTLEARSQLVMSRRREGGYTQYVGPDMTTLLEQMEVVHGREHYRTLSVIANYGNFLREHGDLSQARDLIYEAEAGYRVLFRHSHPIVTGMLSNTALVTLAVGERAEAMPMFESALAGLTATLSPDHPWVLGCALNTATARNFNGRIVEAVELSRDTLRRARRVLGDEHPLTLSCQMALAADLRSARQQEEARKLEGEGLLALTRTLGSQHPHTIAARQRTRPYWDFEPYLD
ncbi:FxSxx-COOH system tetratricopeptide repeat protein [Streptomyces sp. NPDC085866]|uniref:FxSxx-COOH system tetratricopeptide repeat protein n=1 Tax=Streptomyces sp. NPDC085866 TaxID=3365736 RepID=UPI0037D49CA8